MTGTRPPITVLAAVILVLAVAVAVASRERPPVWRIVSVSQAGWTAIADGPGRPHAVFGGWTVPPDEAAEAAGAHVDWSGASWCLWNVYPIVYQGTIRTGGQG